MLKVTLAILVFLVAMSFSVWWKFYQYDDCRKVGHSKTYCVVTFISK